MARSIWLALFAAFAGPVLAWGTIPFGTDLRLFTQGTIPFGTDWRLCTQGTIPFGTDWRLYTQGTIPFGTEHVPCTQGTIPFGTAQARQSPFSVGMAQVEQSPPPSPQPERPTWDRLLFGPAPEGYRGLAISTRLLAWSIPWTLAGSTIGLLSSDPWQRWFWLTHSVWAGVNSGIALVGLLGPEPDKDGLRDLLYINAGLDLLYIAGGTILALQPDPRSQGAGWAIVLQGGWLLLFDLFNALALENPSAPR